MSDLKGLTEKEVEESRKTNGSNALTQIPPESLWKKIMEGFREPMIMILLVALVVEIVMFFMGEADWYEPVGIVIAIILSNGVSSISENKQQKKAAALKEAELAKEKTKVLRDGNMKEIHVSDVVTGDIVYLQAGDKIPADGIILDGSIKVDQAALNGETEEATKEPRKNGESFDTKDLLNKYYAYRGTVVCGGEAYMYVQVVGDATLFGQLALEVQEESRQTPLQVKLAKLAKQISQFGYVGAGGIMIAILLQNVLTGRIPDNWHEWLSLIISAVSTAVTIIVCAVPEGLPSLTSILSSFQSIRKFLIFQLTVNVAAVLTCFIGPMLGENVILTVTQLLMINLAMDTLAAIAFGSEPVLEEYMKERPVPRRENILTKNMMVEILIGAFYITGICLSILFVPAVRNLFGDVDITYLKSALFATFMMAITFNGFNARTEHVNPFEHIGRNKNFLLVMGTIFLMQFVFVTFGGEVLSVERLSAHSWMICLMLAFMVIPIDVVRKLIAKKH